MRYWQLHAITPTGSVHVYDGNDWDYLTGQQERGIYLTEIWLVQFAEPQDLKDGPFIGDDRVLLWSST